MSGFLSYCQPDQEEKNRWVDLITPLSTYTRFIMIVIKNNFAKRKIVVYLFDITLLC